MNRTHKIFGGLLIVSALSLASCIPQPVQLPELPVERIQTYFPEATETQIIDTSFYEVLNGEGQLLGTVLYSFPYAETVKGYNGTTPLLITLDPEGRITHVVMLENHETPRFAERVADGGLYEAWDGLSVNEAIEKQVDAISGATYTSTGVKNTLKARLEAYQRQLAKAPIKQNFWQRLFSK